MKKIILIVLAVALTAVLMGAGFVSNGFGRYQVAAALNQCWILDTATGETVLLEKDQSDKIKRIGQIRITEN